MELRELETFVVVARLAGFTRAAEELHLTQPAITRQIASLEQQLHTRLLERLGRRVELTPSGEALLRYASEILRLAREAEHAVADIATGVSGKLALGANTTTATYILPPMLYLFRERYPGVEMSVHTGISARLVEMVIANVVDLGIVTEFEPRNDLITIPLAEYATGVVVYPEHPFALRNTPVAASELDGSPLVLMEEGTNLRAYVDRLLSSAGVAEQVTMELDNIESIKKMVEARLGISLLPMVSVEAETRAGWLKALPLADVPTAQRRIVVIYRKDKYMSAVLKSFLGLLKERFIQREPPPNPLLQQETPTL